MDYISVLPGGELVEQGIDDLERGIESIPALLVSIGRPRLSQLGYQVPDAFKDPERKLYLRLAETHQEAAHSRYNALIRRLVSFEHAAACAR